MSLPSIVDIRLCLYPYFVRIFPGKEAIENFKMMAPEDPGLHLNGQSQRVSSVWELMGRPGDKRIAEVYVCGIVGSCVKKQNDFTKRNYYEITIDTGSEQLVMVARRRVFWRLPKESEYIAVNGYLAGYIEHHILEVNRKAK